MFKFFAKQNNNKIHQAFSILAIVGVFFTLTPQLTAFAQTADDLQQQKDAAEQQLQGLQSQINSYQSQIKTAQGKVNTLQNQVDIFNLEISETQTQIEETQTQINAANLSIADVSNQIVQNESDINQQKDVLKGLLADINDMDQESPLEIALANNSFSEFLDEVQYTSSVQEQSQETLSKIQQLESDLQNREADLKNEKASLDDLNETLSATNSSLALQQKTKKQLLTQTKGQEKAYQALLADSQEQQSQVTDQINDLDNQIAAKLGNNKLGPEHGLLAWPMQGTLTQGYGNTGFTALGYSFHNGIDIANAAGTKIYAAGDGTVIATGNATPSGEDGAYGNWVAIKHDTGKFAAHPIITLYGHMRSYVLKTGDTVNEGDLVGYEGNTGNTTRILYGPAHGFHLHFTVFDAQGFGVTAGAYPKLYGPYTVPYGATYDPLDFL